MDRSPVGKLDVKGSDLRQWVVRVLGEDAVESPGHARRVRLADGTPVDGLCCWLRDDWAFVIIPAGQTDAVIPKLAPHGLATLFTDDRPPTTDHRDECVHLTDATSVFAALQLVGPQSRMVLEKLTSLDLRPSRFPDLACAQGSLAKVHALVLRDDFAGLPAYWLFVSREYGEFVWEAVFHAGEDYGILPFGHEAYRQMGQRDTRRR